MPVIDGPWNPRCEGCGRFTSYDADYYIPFGGPCDFEPPDPVYMCPRCREESRRLDRQRGRPHDNWVPSKLDREIAEEFGYALAKYPRNGWSIWKKKGEPLPEGMVWSAEEDKKLMEAMGLTASTEGKP